MRHVPFANMDGKRFITDTAAGHQGVIQMCVFISFVMFVCFLRGILRSDRRLVFSLAPLVSKVKEPRVETMVDTLCSNMMSDKEQLRDVSSMGLKTVIAELPLCSSGEQ